MIEISIPVKPHVRKYLMSKYLSDVFPFRRNDHIHATFLSLLQRPSVMYRNPNYKKVEGPKVKFLITKEIKERVGCVMEEENILHFNFFIDYLIKNEFYDFVDSKAEEGMRTKSAIDAFMEKYDLGEEDIKFETLKKAYYRHELKKNPKKSSVKLSRKYTHQTAA